jgi:hypothetical protein
MIVGFRNSGGDIMPNHSPMAKLKKVALSERRTFLKGSVAVGLGAPFFNHGNRAVTEAVSSGCDYKLSAVEALSMFSDLLLRIQSESFNLLNKKILLVAVDCHNQFKKLCESVEQLEVELVKGGKTKSEVQTQQMRVLAEIGCSSAAQLANATSPQDSASLLRSLEAINKQIALAAEQLLPEGDIVLTIEATRHLRLIIAQTHQSAAIQRNIQGARMGTQESRDLIIQGTQEVQRLMFDAGGKILIADDGTSQENQKAREDAIKLLGDAQDRLNRFVTDLKTRELYSEASPTELLLVVLEGTKQWVKDPASVGASSAASQTNDRVRFTLISDLEARATAPIFRLDPQAVTGLLRHCPPDGLIHLGQVMTSMATLIGWKAAMRIPIALGRRGPVTHEEVLNWVRSVLTTLRMNCRSDGKNVPDREKLAQGLAVMIMS